MYDRFADALGLPREAAKSELLSLVFGAPYRYKRDKAVAFSTLYPVTWDQIYSTAYRLYVRGGELARLMQTLESQLMIEGVAARFLREYPHVPVLTCHDALLVPPFAADRAKAIILDEWNRNHAITPVVKVTSWTSPC